MSTRTLHRAIGVVMLLPFLGWAVTGAIFFIKPGYGAAYDALSVKSYPLDAPLSAGGDARWLEARFVKTVLGDHLLVRTADGWRQLDPHSFKERPAPAEPEARALITDAFSANPARYGQIVSLANGVATTSTGVRVSLSWNRLSLSQRGLDTDRIDAIYKVHYLQWTGLETVDRVIGGAGLLLILVLSGLGVRLFFRPAPVRR